MVPSSDPLDRKAVERVDKSRQIDAIEALPAHLMDAVFRAESARLVRIHAPRGIVVCGMGGSAIGGDLAQAAMGDHLSRPLTVVRGYGLPAWATQERLVLLSSYSGDTEETLACFESAGALGAPRLVASTGGELVQRAREEGVPVIGIPAGLQPRCAVAYQFVAALEAAAAAEIAPSTRADVEGASRHLDVMLSLWGPDSPADSLAKEIARASRGAMLMIYGSDLTTPAAWRWKTQMSENAKVLAGCGELPEIDHNEIVGWEGASSTARYVAVFLEDDDQHPRVRRRFELTEESIRHSAKRTFRVESTGHTRTDRLMSLVLLGDLVSLYSAVLRDVDPTPVEAIDRLKAELGVL